MVARTLVSCVFVATCALGFSAPVSPSPRVTYNNGGADWAGSGQNGGETPPVAAGSDAICNTGKAQSPINVVFSRTVFDTKLVPLNASYRPPTTYAVQYDDHSLAVAWNGGYATDGLTFPTGFYGLKQIHIHAPSEHTFNGQNFPLEMHFVHSTAAGRIAIVAVMFRVDSNVPEKDNPFLAKLLPYARNFPQPATSVPNTGAAAPALDILQDLLRINSNYPMMNQYFAYNGSLTSPPCTEGVQWFLLRHAVGASSAQITNITRGMAVSLGGAGRGANARPIQPLNGRKVNTTWAKGGVHANIGVLELNSQTFQNLLSGQQNLKVGAEGAHKLAQAVAALAVFMVLFFCGFVGIGALYVIKLLEVKKLQRNASKGGLSAQDSLSVPMGAL